MKTKLRGAFENFAYLKSLRQEMAVLKLEKIPSSSKFYSLKTVWLLKVLIFSQLKYFYSSDIRARNKINSVAGLLINSAMTERFRPLSRCHFSPCFQIVGSFTFWSDYQLD